MKHLFSLINNWKRKKYRLQEFQDLFCTVLLEITFNIRRENSIMNLICTINNRPARHFHFQPVLAVLTWCTYWKVWTHARHSPPLHRCWPFGWFPSLIGSTGGAAHPRWHPQSCPAWWERGPSPQTADWSRCAQTSCLLPADQ